MYLNLSSAYRTPSLYQLYSEFGNSKLKPEYALTREAGVQFESKNHLLNTRATYFERDIRDVHFFFTDPATYSSRYINQDRQKEKGYELELSYHVGKSTRIQLNYARVDGTITTLKNGKDTTYHNLLRRPKDNFGMSFSSQLHKNWKVNLFAQHYGPREDAYFDNQLFTTVNTRLAAYTVINLGLEYSQPAGKLSVFGELRNALNEKITELSGYATMGRNGFIGFRLRL